MKAFGLTDHSSFHGADVEPVGICRGAGELNGVLPGHGIQQRRFGSRAGNPFADRRVMTITLKVIHRFDSEWIDSLNLRKSAQSAD